MKELEFKFYSNLRLNSIPINRVPKSIKNSLPFKNLYDAKTIDTRKAGRGVNLFIKNAESYEKFFQKYFPIEEELELTKASNIKRLRDSKARKTKSTSIFFIRGFKNISLNNKILDLSYYTKLYGLFSVQHPLIESEKICFVENLDSFLKVEKLIGQDYIYLHKYGRIGIDALKHISAKDIIVFVDYDFNGLDEYLRIKSVFNNAVLYMPENLGELFGKFSKSIDGKQKQSRRVIESTDAHVIQLRDIVSKSNRFLEQEILIND